MEILLPDVWSTLDICRRKLANKACAHVTNAGNLPAQAIPCHTSTVNGLIGYTGFVGGNLLRQHTFDRLYNRQNIDNIAQVDFDVVVCAAPQAVKWWANQNPDEDWQGIERLITALERTRTERFVHLSTIDVFPTLTGVDETFDCHSQDNHAYGRHRLALEDAVRDTFGARAHIIRLPALFGQGLKKNVIYDLMHGNMLDAINPASSFQWYGLNRLWDDINVVLENNLQLCMLATEPIKTQTILEHFFPDVHVGAQANEAHYDVHTQQADIFGNAGVYMRDAETILADMATFIDHERP